MYIQYTVCIYSIQYVYTVYSVCIQYTVCIYSIQCVYVGSVQVLLGPQDLVVHHQREHQRQQLREQHSQVRIHLTFSFKSRYIFNDQQVVEWSAEPLYHIIIIVSLEFDIICLSVYTGSAQCRMCLLFFHFAYFLRHKAKRFPYLLHLVLVLLVPLRRHHDI